MAKSALYTVNNSTQTVPVDGAINLGTIVRRFGYNLDLSGNAIKLDGAGYYELDASVTLEPSAAGEVTLTAYLNGIALSGATASETVATEDTPVNLSICALIREGCPCCNSNSNITFVLTGTESNVTNIATITKKI